MRINDRAQNTDVAAALLGGLATPLRRFPGSRIDAADSAFSCPEGHNGMIAAPLPAHSDRIAQVFYLVP